MTGFSVGLDDHRRTLANTITADSPSASTLLLFVCELIEGSPPLVADVACIPTWQTNSYDPHSAQAVAPLDLPLQPQRARGKQNAARID